jgi:uncharacterized membrane-anchored protein YitT (DUF2179 family)
VLLNLTLLTAGSCIFAIGVNGVLVPNHFLSGGIVGISLIAHYLFPGLNMGVVYFALNVPLILFGWFTVSRRFILYTFFGMSVFSLTAGILSPKFPVVENPILSAILAGIICGTGIGISLRSQGSGGGLNILAVYLSMKVGIRTGVASFMINAAILGIAAYFIDLQAALYSLVYEYTRGKITDAVVTGFNQRKSVLVISESPEAIADRILADLNRGVTFFPAVGGYSGEKKEALFSIITITELAKMKELVFDTDPKAFMVVNDTLEVIGKRHGSRRMY